MKQSQSCQWWIRGTQHQSSDIYISLDSLTSPTIIGMYVTMCSVLLKTAKSWETLICAISDHFCWWVVWRTQLWSPRMLKSKLKLKQTNCSQWYIMIIFQIELDHSDVCYIIDTSTHDWSCHYTPHAVQPCTFFVVFSSAFVFTFEIFVEYLLFLSLGPPSWSWHETIHMCTK